MYSLKLSFNNEHLRFTLRVEDGNPCLSYDELLSISAEGFQSLQSSTFPCIFVNEANRIFPISKDKDFIVHWLDEDEDNITIKSGSDLQHALDFMKRKENFNNVFKFIITARAAGNNKS